MTEQGGSSEDNLRRVREKVMQLAREIEQLSGEEISAEVFFREFLVRVVTAIGARAGAVWLIDSGRLSMTAEVNLDQTGLRELPGAMQTNEKLLIEVLQTGEAKTLTHGQSDIELPTEHVMVLSALHKDKECVGVVQLFQRSDVPDKARSGYMQFLEQMSGYASRYLEGKRNQAGMTADMQSKFWTDFEQFTLRIQRSLNEQEVADASASDARPLLGCDRLSIATKKGRKVKVRAVSGQSTVNGRANLIQAMAKLCRRAIDSGETLIYTGKIEGLAPQIEKPLANFVQESGARLLLIVPMFPNQEMVREQGEDAERKRKSKKPKASGCLVIEQVNDSEPAADLERRAELLADHIGAALWNSRTHGRIFGRSVWKLMGKTLEWFQGRKLAITTAVLAAIAGLVAAGTLIKMEYPVEANGKMMPVRQEAVFVPHDGQVSQIVVEPNAAGVLNVKAGDPILYLVDPDLDTEIKNAESEVAKQLELKQATERVVDSIVETDDPNVAREKHQKDIELIRIKADLRSAEVNLQKLLKRREDELTVRAPISGIIADFKRMDILKDRPVQKGEHLFDVMDPTGDWHLELLVAEKRMGHINRALEKNRKEISEGQEPTLQGSFTMVSLPESKFKCLLTELATRSTIDQEIGTAFELTAVAADGEQVPTTQIGTEVTCRFDCGECTLAFYLFGDVVEFVQRKLWYW